VTWAGSLAAIACGARTDLDAVRAGPPNAAEHDAADDVHDAADDVRDAGNDVRDAADDVRDADLACPDGAAPTAYLLDQNGSLYTYSPQTLRADFVATPKCTSALPWTLSVSREGVAYLVYEDWRIYAFDLKTHACTPTPYRTGQLGISSGQGIAVSRASSTETLFVYGRPAGSVTTLLARADLTSFVLSEVGQPIASTSPETGFDMQADLSGHLFVYTPDGVVAELDATTAAVIDSRAVGFPPFSDSSWAIMTYQDEVFLFGDLQVARYDRASRTATVLGTVTGTSDIVGASAVPCTASP
jgi:hypothetical protein